MKRDASGLFGRILSDNVSFPPWFDNGTAKDLVSRLLSKDPRSRLGRQSANDVKGHEFFVGVEWSSLVTAKSPPFNRNLRVLEIPDATDDDSSLSSQQQKLFEKF